MIKYDDVGSLPLPENIGMEEFERRLLDFEDEALEIIEESIKLKIKAGVEVPCYPQLRHMNSQFLSLLTDPEKVDEPYLIREDEAYLPELLALERWDIELPPVKVCVTGPLELSVAEFGSNIYEDIILNLAQSLSYFIENAQEMTNLDIEVVSIDEPSLGVNSQLICDDETLVQAWDIAGRADIDVQLHLHSTVFLETACRADNLNILDIGVASNPTNLETVDSETLESYGKSLRAGVSRTDVLSMGSEFNKKNNVNIWEDKDVDWQDFPCQMDPPERIAERIEKVHEKLGDRVEYLGPECGLRGAGSRDLARKILENTRSGIELSRNR